MDKEILDLANRFFQQQEQHHDAPIRMSLELTATEAKEITSLLEKLRHG